MPLQENILRTGGIMHGGAIMTLLDAAGGLSILTLGNLVNQVTITLKPERNPPFPSVRVSGISIT